MRALVLSAVVVGLAACSGPSPAPTSETSTPAAAIEAPAASLSLGTLSGRWVLEIESCTTPGTGQEDLIAITATGVDIGPQACTAAGERAEKVADGVEAVEFDAECTGADGVQTTQRVRFVTSTPDTLTWVKPDGSAAPYSRCPS